MMRQTIAVILSFVCLSAFAGASDNLKQQLVGIPAGTVIEVKLQQKGSKKITGRLGLVSDEGFEIQSGQSGTVASEKVAFADVKSVKEKRGMRGGVKTLIIAGIVFVAIGATLSAIQPNN
jgi:hypothetical protein